MSSIYKNGRMWYYQTVLMVDERKERFQKSLGTSDKEEAQKQQMHYDYLIEYENRNPFIEKRDRLSENIDYHLTYREKLVKRRLIAQRTYDNDRGALFMFHKIHEESIRRHQNQTHQKERY